jgi:hypothetical protein
MNNDPIRRALLHLDFPEAPLFERVALGPSTRRLRKVRAGIAALVLIALACAPFLLSGPGRQTDFALATPPTTDWLLETPDPGWIASLDRRSQSETETNHVQ